METVSWDKGCGVSCRRRHSVGEVSLQTKEKGSCMHDYLIYIRMACVCLCLWCVPKSEWILPEDSQKNPQNPLSTEAATNRSGGNRKGGMVF